MGGISAQGFSGCARLAWWSSSDSNQPPKCYGISWCPTNYPGRTPIKTAGEEQRRPGREGAAACPTRVVGRTRTTFHNALVADEVSESQENQAKQQKRPTIWIGVRPG